VIQQDGLSPMAVLRPLPLVTVALHEAGADSRELETPLEKVGLRASRLAVCPCG